MKTAHLLLVPILLALSPFVKGQGPSPSPTPETREQTVYVPFEKLEQVFENQERGVFLPYREFLELWNKLTFPALSATSQPPVEGVLASAKYTGRVEGDAAVIKAVLECEALKEGWSTLKLGSGSLSIADVKSTAVLNYKEGGYEIIFPSKGRYTVEMTIYGRVVRETGNSKLQLELPRTAASQIELTIPEKGLNFELAPASAFTTSEQGDATKVSAYFGNTDKISMTWTRRGTDTALTPLLFAESTSNVHISAGAARTSVEVGYRILRAGVNSFELLLSAEPQVLSVEGADIRDWNVAASGAQQKLTVTLHTPARERYALKVQLEQAIAGLPAKVTAPRVEIGNATRQAGSIAITYDPELLVTISELKGLAQQAAGGEKRAGLLAGRYRFLSPSYTAAVTVNEAQPLVDVTSETLLTVEPETLSLNASVEYAIRKAGIFAARIRIPAGFKNIDVTGDGVESFTSETGAAGQPVLIIRFKTRQAQKTNFKITADAQRTAPDAPATAPVLVPEGVERHTGKTAIAVSTGLKANTTDSGDLRQEDVRTFTLKPANPALTPLTLGFRYREDAKPAQIAFEQRKPRVSADVFASLDIGENVTGYEWTIRYNIEYAGVNELEILVPEEIAGDIQIDGENIKERLRVPQTTGTSGDSTGVRWRVLLQDKQLGSYTLNVSGQAPQSALSQGGKTSISLPEIRVLNVFREAGQIAVRKDGNLELTNTAPKGLEAIDPKELDPILLESDAYLAFKYSTHPIALQLDVSKNLFLEVPAAVVTHAVLNSVIAENKAETVEAIFWVRNNSQPFLAVTLPERGRLLSDAFVDGEPQQPSRRPEKNEMLIRLPMQTGTHDVAVRLVYEIPSKKAESTLWPLGKIAVTPPVIADTRVLETKWNFYLPDGYKYVKFAGPMREQLPEWGWERFRRGATFAVFNIGGKQTMDRSVFVSEPPIAGEAKGGFDFQLPKSGVHVALYRLDAPAPVKIHYRSKTFANLLQATLFLVALFFGLRRLNAPADAKLRYAFIAGGGALVLAAAVMPRAAGIWTSIYLGVFFSVLVWTVAGMWRKFRAWRERRAAARLTKIRAARPVVTGAATPPPPMPEAAPGTSAPEKQE